MRSFEFKGDWETVVQLDRLSLLQDDKFFRGIHSEKIKEQLVQGLVPLKIHDSFDHDPDPSPEQIATITYIKDNEDLILDAIFREVSTVVYPFMKTLADDEEWWFPRLDSKDDLKKALGVLSIEILRAGREGFSCFAINFNASWDPEHGFHIALHKNKVLGTGQAWDIDSRKIAGWCGLDFEREVQQASHWDDDIVDFIEPHPKYNKLKPVEVDANNSLPFRLIATGRSGLLMEYIDNGKVSIDYGFVKGQSSNSLLRNAIFKEDVELVRFLTDKGIRNFLDSLQAAEQLNNGEISEIVRKYYEKDRDKLWLTPF